MFEFDREKLITSLKTKSHPPKDQEVPDKLTR